MLLFGQVNSNLMRSARFQSTLNERIGPQALHDFDMRDRLLAQAGNGRAAAPAVTTVAHQKAFDAAGLGRARHDRQVAAQNAMPMELSTQAALRLDGPREDN